MTICKSQIQLVAFGLAFLLGGLPSFAVALEILRPGDSIWEISSRDLPECIPTNCNFNFKVSRLENCTWNASSEAALLTEAIENPIRTIIYAHGNWFSVCDARDRVQKVYRQAICLTNEPIRIILVSWPSEKRDRFAKDVIGKKTLLSASSFYLANFIERYPDTQPIGLLGYSFGGRIVCGALHLMHGGTIDGHSLCFIPRSLECYKMGLIAPAFDSSALAPGGKFSEAMKSIDHLVNLYNSRDPILRRFRFFDRQNEPVAAGFSGLAGLSGSMANQPLENDPRIEQFDCRVIGRTHDELEYFKCSAIRNCLLNVLGM